MTQQVTMESLSKRVRQLEVVLENIKALGREDPPEIECAMDQFGGNFDDAYSGGWDHGEIAAYNRVAAMASKALLND